MRKCSKCGHVEIYWSPLRFDTDQDYAHVDNVPFASEIPFGEALAVTRADGFVYWRSADVIRRMALEEYRNRGNHTHPVGSYKESFRTRKKLELEATNMKLKH
jgi:hypothetical protein